MATAKISKSTVNEAMKAKPDRDTFTWDDEVPGFGLKVTPVGACIYVYQYRMPYPGRARAMPTRRLTLGKHGELTPDQARKEAKRLAALVTQGTDPRQQDLDAHAAWAEAQRQAEEQERLDEELAFEKVAERWLSEYEIEHRPRSHEQAALAINRHLMPKLRGRPLPSISKDDLKAIINGIPARQKASRRNVFAYASVFWGWAIENGLIAENPVTTMPKPKGPKAREKVLADTELASIWHATATIRAPLGAFYRVLLLTGQRREEVAGMDWVELDRASATWIIPAGRAKNGAAHIVPLAPAVVEELDRLSLARQVKAGEEAPEAKRWPKGGPVMSIRGGVSLSCFSQAKRLLDTAIAKVRGDAEPMEAWRVHDLRRTMATGFQKLGIRFEVTEATLNHVSGAKGGVAGIYQRHDWKTEKRDALEAWARHVASILTPADETNVVPLRAETAA